MLRIALIIFAATLASQANATTWMDTSCAVGLASEAGGKFQYINGEKAEPMTECTLTKAQELSCVDGKIRQLVALPDNQVMVDNVRMFAVGDENPEICD